MVQTSVVGKIVGSICAFFCIVSISIPLAIVASNVSDYYKYDERMKKILKQMESKNSQNPVDSDTKSWEGSDKVWLKASLNLTILLEYLFLICLFIYDF